MRYTTHEKRHQRPERAPSQQRWLINGETFATRQEWFEAVRKRLIDQNSDHQD